MGWGWIPTSLEQQADLPHVDSPPDDFSAQDFWRWVREATNWDIFSGDANALANSRAVAARTTWASSGLPAYFDMAEDTAAQHLRFGVMMRHPGPEGIVVTTRSAGETFFARPYPRLDGRRESQNLFHPYWQARLGASDFITAYTEAP